MGIFNIFKTVKDVADVADKTINTVEKGMKDAGKLVDETEKTIKKAIDMFGNIKKTLLTKDSLSNKKIERIPLEKASTLNKGTNQSVQSIKEYVSNNKDVKGKLQKVENVQNSNISFAINPAQLITIGMLVVIEKQIEDIKKTTKDIYNFLQYEKESEIESNYLMLEKINKDYRYYIDDDRMLISQQTNVTNIQRESKKHIISYKKSINDTVLQNNLIVINNTMDGILDNLGKNFDYYRIALYTWAYSSLTELYLLKNYKPEYLESKKNEITALKEEYKNIYDLACSYIEKNANKSVEGNTLKVVGKAGEAAGKLVGTLKNKVSFMKDKEYDKWLEEKGSNLSNKGNEHIKDFIAKFEKERETNLDDIVHEINKIDDLNNGIENIYFDEENIYLEYKSE